MAENVFPIVDVFLSLDNYQTKCCCVRHKVLCSLSFSSSILTVFPFSSSPLLSVSGSILSRISMLAGSRGGGLRNSISIYIFTSRVLTDRRSFPYLANFMAAGSLVGAIELSCPVFGVYILHPKLR
jgi:hypothetical protein